MSWMLPSMSDNHGSYSFSDPITFCYGLKTTYYAGDDFLFFLQLTLISLSTASAEMSSTAQSVPANYTLLSVGVSYKFDS